MSTELTDDQRVTVANARLDQLIASVHGHLPNDLYCVQQFADQLAARPCNQTAADHIKILAHNLALALFRLASQGQEQPWPH